MGFLKKMFDMASETGKAKDNVVDAVAYLDCKKLTIGQLSKPLFLVPATKHEVNDKSPIAGVCRKNRDRDFDIQNQQYKKELRHLINEYPSIDPTYFYLSRPYVVKEQYDEAMTILCEGFNKADYRGNLAYFIGVTYLLQHKVQSIGWHMQACLLASTTSFAYKNLAMAAQEIGMERLYWRLKNAGDVIDTKHIPMYEEEMRLVTRVANKDKLQIKEEFKNFENEMNLYLPGEDDIPKDVEKRENYLLIEQSYLIRANMKLLSRGDVTYCSL